MKRWPFLILFFVNAIAVGILVAYGQDTVLAKIPTLQQCDHVQRPHCMGNQTIFRASMAIGVFFLFMMGWSASTESGHNRGCTILALELPLYAGLSIGAFFVPNTVASGVFIVMQIVILLDCVYDIRDYVLNKIQASPDSVVWPVVYLLLSFSSLVATIVGLVYLFLEYAGSPLAVVFMVITAVFAVLLPALGVSDKIGSGLLPPAAMTMYLVFLCWQAVSKLPNITPSIAASSPILVPSAIIGAFTVSWTCWRTSEATKSLFRLEMHPGNAAATPPFNPPNDAAAVVTNPSSTCDNDVAVVIADAPPTAPSWQFFFIMFVSSFYMAMVMTNWGVNETQGSDKSNVVSVWVQIVSQWTTSLLFLWSLVAPVVLPHRDFA